MKLLFSCKIINVNHLRNQNSIALKRGYSGGKRGFNGMKYAVFPAVFFSGLCLFHLVKLELNSLSSDIHAKILEKFQLWPCYYRIFKHFPILHLKK